MKKIVIKEDEIGLVIKDGTYEKHLKPGRYTLWQPKRRELTVIKTRGKVSDQELLQILQKDAELMKRLELIKVEDYELVLVFEDKRLCSVLGAGEYAFWKVLHHYTFQRVDIRNSDIENDLQMYTKHPLVVPYVLRLCVEPYEKGLLYLNREFSRVLEPGEY
ncbi:MAG: hypothetical protein ACRCTE_08565, partial [Cellulosilyticaceae bacterium]